MRRSLILLSFVAAFSLLTAARVARAAKLRLGYSAMTATMAPLWAAREMGFFAKHGIEEELIYLVGARESPLP